MLDVLLRRFQFMDLSSKTTALQLRARVLTAVRSFFVSRDYLEVETPIRVNTPAMEDHIDAEASGDAWLRTSPELHMKRMVCAGFEKIFQVGPCFRQGERGQRHLPEYTMLEWYWTGVSSEVLIGETCDLLQAVADVAGGGPFDGVDLKAAPKIYTISELFLKWAGWDPVLDFDADRFDFDLVEKVEPVLSKETVPVVVKNFPAERAALARMRPENPQVADRWEMYVGGVELANAYTELTDAREQRTRFEVCAEERSGRGQEVYPLDEAFLTALERGMPDCAGIALGVDRLLMRLVGTDEIADVVAFA
ncbi:EF-P lysine aminoacylase EpmA [Kiritimatiellaeota bacterium B1221]|nr:EF-P lysine aminoacylase EpmA [Kiritimatiellaeota bacterium B1221]